LKGGTVWPPVTVEGMPPERPVVPLALLPMLPKLVPPLLPPSRPSTPFEETRSRV
jgi:hypothetical protein